jgi:hypothetical protein
MVRASVRSARNEVRKKSPLPENLGLAMARIERDEAMPDASQPRASRSMTFSARAGKA